MFPIELGEFELDRIVLYAPLDLNHRLFAILPAAIPREPAHLDKWKTGDLCHQKTLLGMATEQRIPMCFSYYNKQYNVEWIFIPNPRDGLVQRFL